MIKKIVKRVIPRSFRLNIQSWRHRPVFMYPHGHFYSPITSRKEIKEFEKKVWNDNSPAKLDGIDLNIDYQLHLLKFFEPYYKEMPFRHEKSLDHRYYFNNNSYEYTDAITLYSFIRYFNPKRIIEIGSGFSSALMLDTRDIFNLDFELTFIEPYPKLLLKLLRKNDIESCKILDTKVQNVSMQEFSKLKENDILFIDSSHVSKTGSDVNYEIFDILPGLSPGVLIHFHDIFYPFEYPKEWVFAGSNWNEDYLLRAFLSYNNKFEILFFSHLIHEHFKSAFDKMPLTYKNPGGNLWLRKK